MRSQTDTLPNIRGKAILVIKQQWTWLNCVPVLVLWKVEVVSSETGYLALEISKQSVEAVAQFLLTAYSKIGEERNELKKEL